MSEHPYHGATSRSKVEMIHAAAAAAKRATLFDQQQGVVPGCHSTFIHYLTGFFFFNFLTIPGVKG